MTSKSISQKALKAGNLRLDAAREVEEDEVNDQSSITTLDVTLICRVSLVGHGTGPKINEAFYVILFDCLITFSAFNKIMITAATPKHINLRISLFKAAA